MFRSLFVCLFVRIYRVIDIFEQSIIYLSFTDNAIFATIISERAIRSPESQKLPNGGTVMKLIGNLKKTVEEAESKDEKKSLIYNAGMELTDDELDMVSGGKMTVEPTATLDIKK